MKTLLYGAQVDSIQDLVRQYPNFDIVDDAPELVICYGGDGTLLTAEQRWPGVPKVPIRNSSRGNRCIARPADEVIERLASGKLARAEFIKLAASVKHQDSTVEPRVVIAMNEINVHMGNVNSAVRVKLWIDNEAYSGGDEILGDGLVISTPFGSTAYYNKITRGIFYTGMGIAFNNTTEQTSHVVVPDHMTIRVLITRGPAVLTFDNSNEYIYVQEGNELTVRKHAQPATIFSWAPMSHPSDQF